MRLFEGIRPGVQSLLHASGRALTALAISLNVLGLLGFVARDRTIVLAYLMCLPLLPIGLLTIGLGLVPRRTHGRRLRGLLVLIGMASALSSLSWMIGRGGNPAIEFGRPGPTVLHWNVLWGGFWKRHDFQWQSMAAEIIERDPDVLFNAVSRSIGFDALEVAGDGYDLASRYCQGWRGAWPSPLPLLDIDHGWVRAAWKVVDCRFLSNLGTDHRGQFVRLVKADRVSPSSRDRSPPSS